MSEEKKDEELKDEKLAFKNADELTSFLMDLQGQIGSMQETINTLSSEEKQSEEKESEEKESEENESLSESEINEIDRLLQSN